MILALDSSSLTASVALVREGRLVAEFFQNTGLTHSQTLIPLLEALLRITGVNPGEIRRVAVTNGPGSFTGLRIGVASALGWAQARDVPCVGVSSLEAAAWAGLGQDRPVCAVMDARRDQFYSALFQPSGGRLVRLSEDRAVSAAELAAGLAATPCLMVGDGAHLLCGPDSPHVPAPRPHASAWGAALCALAGHERPPVPITYLRPPQAERERLDREWSGKAP